VASLGTPSPLVNASGSSLVSLSRASGARFLMTQRVLSRRGPFNLLVRPLGPGIFDLFLFLPTPLEPVS